MTSPSTPTELDRPRHAAVTTTSDPVGDGAATEPVVVATDLALSTRRGPVFGPVTFEIAPDRLTLISGPSGTGRSALLLAITGRMSKITGRLEVAGVDGIGRHRAVRAITSVARIGTLVDLEPQLTVGESITERTLVDAINPGAGHERFDRLSALIGLDLDRGTLVDDLGAADRTLLTVLLAALRPSRLIVLDDLDRATTGTEQIMIIDRLGALGADGHTVVATLTDPEPAAADTAVVRLLPTPTLD